MDFSKLKRQSGNLDKLTKAVEALSQSSEGNEKSDNFWKPEVDKAGNGMAVIRFLPAAGADGDDALPWIKVFTHGFQGPSGQWLIDSCLTTKDQQCPICEANSQLWNSGIEANKAVARDRKRKLTYMANVYIVSDPKHPENEGKVKLFKFGKKIFDKISEAMHPEFEDEQAINPFDLWEGANFKLKIRKVDGYQNYDKSEFESPSPLKDDDDEMEQIWKSEFSLKAIFEKGDPAFKTYDQLKGRLDKVLGLTEDSAPVRTTVEQAKAAAPKAKPVAEDSPFKEPNITEEDDDMKYFESLASDD
jgi:hypothetical protein